VERIYYYWCHGLFPAYSGLGPIDASKLRQVSTSINDRKLHITNEIELCDVEPWNHVVWTSLWTTSDDGLEWARKTGCRLRREEGAGM
jgi:hypothetical protein